MNLLAAKQEAFEEANRLKNQFRSLDEDEIEFLDSVLETTRAEEQRVKRETAEGLEQFRKQQEEADKRARRGSDGAQVADNGYPIMEEEQWAAGGRKRKRAKEKDVIKGVKIRRSSTAEKVVDPVAESSWPSRPSAAKNLGNTSRAAPSDVPVQPTQASDEKTPAAPAKAGLGLVDYGSDDDE